MKEYLRLYFWDIISKHYFDFRGRTGRKTFWLFTLNMAIINLILGIFSLTILSIIVSLFLLTPSFCITIKRLHDIDFSGWWVLIGFIPLLGFIALIVMNCIKGTEGENRFGLEEGFSSENIVE